MNKMDKVSQIIRKAIVNWNEMDIDISISDYISAYLLKSGMEFVVHCEDCVYYKKGYEMKSAQVHFVIAWKGKESTNEVPVILPTVTIGKTVSDY